MQLSQLETLLLGAIHDNRYYIRDGNKLTTLPDSLPQLTRLTTLDLSGNSFVSVPDCITRLTNLSLLDLSNNRIRELPDGIARLNRLQILKLGGIHDEKSMNYGEGGNLLTELPGSLIELSQLNTLDLSNNKLTMLPEFVGQLTQLASLDLSWNKLTTLPEVQLTELTNLNLGGNQLSTLPDTFGQLTQLTALDLRSNQLTRLPEVVGQLTQLKELYLSDNKLTTLPDTFGQLTQLTALDLRSNQLTRLPEVVGQLTQLTNLNLSSNQLTTLPDCLGLLTQLKELYLSDNKLTTLPEVVGQLTQLTNLNLSSNQLTPLPKVVGQLIQLKEFYLSDNKLTTLPEVVGQLTQLKEFYLSNNKFTTLPEVVGQLTQLMTLDLRENQLTTLPATFDQLTALHKLDLFYNSISDISILSELSLLKELRCSRCHLGSDFKEIWLKDSLEEVILQQSTVPGIPAEILSQASDDNCLHRLRVYFKDLEAGKEPVSDVKLIMLGNGRVGKTQICRRLRGEGYDESISSTHGIQITSTPLPLSDEGDLVRLQIWDFGGQDIYHGTHTLFLRSRAVFVIVWALEIEDKPEHEYGGYLFRNEPLLYWVNYVRQAAGADSPVLIVQTRCDGPEDIVVHSPVQEELLNDFSFTPEVLHYSALNNWKRASLDESLYDATKWLRGKTGAQYIGSGWAKVKQKLETLRDLDRQRPDKAKKHRTLSHYQFQAICSEVEGVSEPEVLLKYLHDSGIVFYRPDLFANQIILDQAWALEAIYAVLERENCYQRLLQKEGRFTRSDLGDFYWNAQGYGIEEQKLFLSMMKSCGICFEYRPADNEKGIEAVYIAPDLLPEHPAGLINAAWEENRPDTEEVVIRYELLLPGLMRAIISKIGAKAGLGAEYWRHGVYVYEEQADSRALIEQQRDSTGWSGSICIRAQRGDAKLLLDKLVELIEEQEQQFNIKSHKDVKLQNDPDRNQASANYEPRFVAEPSDKPEYFVSYAWNDKSDPTREEIVDRICAEAEARDVIIVRDKTQMGLGDSIPKFMQRIGEGNRVFVILSDKYLRSEFCMYELYEIWRNCRQNGKEFIKRVRVFTMPCADIWSISDRVKWAEYWKYEYDSLESKASLMAVQDYKGFKHMQNFYVHVGEILVTVTSILLPKNFEQLKKYGFDDPKSSE